MLSLTPSQKKAIETSSKGVLVLAGPGSGKTRTILGRLRYLLEHHVSPERIVVITFTQKSALELKTRLNQMGLPCENLFTGTIHALAKETLRERNLYFEIADDDELISIIKKGEPANPEKTLQELSLKRNLLQKDPLQKYLIEELQKKGLIDFDGLLEMACDVLKTEPAKTLEHILIDEVQDLTPLQFEFIKTLCQDMTSVFAVGDDDQAIYSFRGSDPEIMRVFTETFSPCSVLVLEENFRNPFPLYKLASALISCNRNRFPKDIVPAKKDGPKPRLYIFPNPSEEARFIAREIKKLTGGTGYHDLSSIHHRSPSEFAVLVRTKSQVPPIMDAIEREGLPVVSLNDEMKKRHDEITNIISFLGTLSNDTMNLKDLKEEIQKFCSDTFLQRYLEDVFYGIRLLPVHDAKIRLIEALKYLKKEPIGEPSHEAVNIMTIHASKGLEFPVVFIAGCEEKLLPLNLEGLSSQEEEERRLLYVAMTRAKEDLIMTCSQRRTLFGKNLQTGPSKFLKGLELLYEVKPWVTKKDKPFQKGLF